VLFQDDLRVIVGTKSIDPYFYYVTFVCFGIFLIEIGISSYAKPDYLNSFFFYLDLVSTVTLLLDIGWISDQIFGQSSTSAKAAKLGTKATRLIRIIRLIRLIRIVKLYKAAQMHREKKHQEQLKEKLRIRKMAEQIRAERTIARNRRLGSADSGGGGDGLKNKSGELSIPDAYREGKQSFGPALSNPKSSPSPNSRATFKISDKFNASSDLNSADDGPDLAEAEDYLKESNVNKTLTGNINKIVIVIILLIMLSVPLFSPETYLTENYDAPSAAFFQLER
jgi:hypothetical protein